MNNWKQCPFCRSSARWNATVCPACTRVIDTGQAINAREATAAQRRRRLFLIGLVGVAALAILGSGKSKHETSQVQATTNVAAAPGIVGSQTLGLKWDIEHSSWIATEDREMFRAAAIKILFDDENCKSVQSGGGTLANQAKPYFITCEASSGKAYNVFFSRNDLSAHGPLRGIDDPAKDHVEGR